MLTCAVTEYRVAVKDDSHYSHYLFAYSPIVWTTIRLSPLILHFGNKVKTKQNLQHVLQHSSSFPELCYLRRRRRLCFWFGLFVCLSVCPSDYSQTCEQILTKFFLDVGHGSRTKWYNFGGDPDHALDPGDQSPKSGSSTLLKKWKRICVMPCSAEVCALWVLLLLTNFRFQSGLGCIVRR